MNLIKKDFFLEFSISQNDFDYCEFNWDELIEIREDYIKTIPELQLQAAHIVGQFTKDCKDIHSIRYRIKDADHLIAKIIRLKISNKNLSNINIENYKYEIKDIIGFRLLHIFKEDWIKLFKYLDNNYKNHESPFAYYRTGDDESYIKNITNNGIRVYPNEDGYRSIHVIIETESIKKDSKQICEIQIRTVFEEAWSEIGHSVRYPNNVNNPVLNNYFKIYNRFVGTLDEMGTFIRSSNENDKILEKHKNNLTLNVREILLNESSLDLETKDKIKTFYNALTSKDFDSIPISIVLENRRSYFMKAIQLIREKPRTYRSVIEGPSFLHPKWVVSLRDKKNKKMPNYDTDVLKYIKNHSNINEVKFIIRLSNRYKQKLEELIPLEKRNKFKTEMIDILNETFGNDDRKSPQILCQLTGFISISEIFDDFALESDKISENEPLSKGKIHSDEKFVSICKQKFDSIFQWNYIDNKTELEKLIYFYQNIWKDENN